MKVEVWSDVVCPWCYIGRRRLEKAVAEFDGSTDLEVVFRSYELDPNASSDSDRTATERRVDPYGRSTEDADRAHARVSAIAATEGLEFHLETARPTNTLDAHRLLQLAGVRRIRPAVEERFLRAYFTEGARLADPATLLRLGTEAGLSEGEVRRVLAGQAFTLQVRMDEQDAASLGATGVPFFSFDRRRFVRGAQPVDTLRSALAGTPGAD